MHSLLCFLILSSLCQYVTNGLTRARNSFNLGKGSVLFLCELPFIPTPPLLKKNQSSSLHLCKEHLLYILFCLLRKVTNSHIRAKEKKTKIDLPATNASCCYVLPAGPRGKSADCVIRYSFNFITVNIFHSWSSLMPVSFTFLPLLSKQLVSKNAQCFVINIG